MVVAPKLRQTLLTSAALPTLLLSVPLVASPAIAETPTTTVEPTPVNTVEAAHAPTKVLLRDPTATNPPESTEPPANDSSSSSTESPVETSYPIGPVEPTGGPRPTEAEPSPSDPNVVPVEPGDDVTAEPTSEPERPDTEEPQQPTPQPEAPDNDDDADDTDDEDGYIVWTPDVEQPQPSRKDGGDNDGKNGRNDQQGGSGVGNEQGVGAKPAPSSTPKPKLSDSGAEGFVVGGAAAATMVGAGALLMLARRFRSHHAR